MEEKIPLKYIAAVLCALAFSGVLLGVGYIMGGFFLSYEGSTPTTEPTTEATTEATTAETTEETTEATTEETTEATTEETTEETVPEVKLPAMTLKGKQGFLYIPETGQLIMVKGKAGTRIYPASLTKLFTAYVALGVMKTDDKVTVGNELSLVEKGSSVAGLTRGDVLTVQTLIEAMLLPSGNDAATVLAVAAGRKLAGNSELSPKSAVARFVKEMNIQAKNWGLSGTHFANPDGYHKEDHYTTCRDMVKIGELALSNSVIRRAMATPEKVVSLQNPYVSSWINTNLLLQEASEFYNPHAIGMKTGYTSFAGNCLMAAFEANGQEIILGIFGCKEADDRFVDANKIYNAYIKTQE